MYISTFYGVVKQNNGYFKIFYPVYSNGDISPVVNGSEFNSFSTARNQADLAYLDLQSVLANVDNISVYGNYELLYENNNYLIQQVVLEVNLNQSSEPDYTNILTNINNNLTNLNTNITNKNNQSDIVSCLNNIFCYPDSNNNFISSIRYVNNPSDMAKRNLNLSNLLFNLLQLLSNKKFTMKNLNEILNAVDFSCFSDISKKLSSSIPSNSGEIGNFDIRQILAASLKSFSDTNSILNVSQNSFLKSISDKLANANDLHTISQAIDLISTAIAQSPTTDVSGLTTAVQNLKLESNNLIQVEGDIDYRIKYDKNKEE